MRSLLDEQRIVLEQREDGVYCILPKQDQGMEEEVYITDYVESKITPEMFKFLQ